MPPTALAKAATLLAPLLLLPPLLLHVVAAVGSTAMESTAMCPSVPTLASNCSDSVSSSGWCVLGPSASGGMGGAIDCANDNSTSSDKCSWQGRGIVDVANLPFDCETLDLSGNSISRLVAPDLSVMETSALVQLNLQCNNFTSLDGLKLPSSVARLNLSDNFIDSIYVDADNASVIPFVLDVSNNPITSMDLQSAHIIFLYAMSVNVRDMADVSVSNSTIYLYCSNNTISDFHSFRPSEAMRHLDMSNGTIEKIHRTNFSIASGLETLNFADNEVSSVEGVIFPPYLKNLWLNGSSLRSFLVRKSDVPILKALTGFQVSSIEHDNCSSPSSVEEITIANGSYSVCVMPDDDFMAAYFADAADKDKTASWIYPVVVALVGAVALAIIVIATVLYRRKKQRAINATRSTGGLSGGMTGTHQSVLDSIQDDEELVSFRVPQEDVTMSRVLAKGGFGVVWIATLRGTDTIVVKQLLPEKAKNPRVVAHFVEEIRLCVKLDHPKIVRFLGIAWSTLADLSILLEYMPNGDLACHLRNSVSTKSTRRRGGPPIEDVYSWTATDGLVVGRTKLQLALDVAEALAFLHSFDKPIIHRDLKAQNVLLSDSWEAKLTDFGVSREVDEAMTAEVGTVAWIAPEILKGKVYSEKADIYSFGVLLSEMDTHDKPYTKGIPDMSGDGVQAPSNARIALAVIEKRLQPSFRAECPPEIATIALRCLSYEASSRPSTEELVRELVDVGRPSQASSHESSNSAGSSGGSAGSYIVV